MNWTDRLRYMKKALVALTAAVGVAITALSDGQLDGTELIEIVLAGLGAAGVYQATNYAPIRRE